jgi:hypothetical protein
MFDANYDCPLAIRSRAVKLPGWRAAQPPVR